MVNHINIPLSSFLYKYRNFSTDKDKERLEAILFKNQIYFPCFTELNDPNEGKYKISLIYNKKEKFEDGNKLVKRACPNINRKERRKLAKDFCKLKEFPNKNFFEYGIYSLSSSNNNYEMWEQYTDNHKGLCLEFKLSTENPFFEGAIKIDYVDELSTINFNETSKNEQIIKIFFTKERKWEYENEWRLINEKKGLLNFPEELLTGIIFGYKMPEKDKNQIIKWKNSKNLKLKLYQITVDEKDSLIVKNLIN